MAANNDYFDKLLEDSLRRLSETLAREVLRGIGPPSPGGDGSPSGGVTVIVNNNTGASVSVRETPGEFDSKQLEIAIDQMVADALVRGRRTTGVLGSLFSIVPGLAGR